MFGIGKLKKRVAELESNFIGLSQVAHDHKVMYYEENPGDWGKRLTVSEACELLMEKEKQNKQMRRELNAIHGAWCKQICTECLHIGICKKTLRYGEECTGRMVL